jgi:glycosyltransferase involved in cell wall biosynthesis
VVPLHDVDFDAGVTTIAEAMAMSKAVVVTRTRGQVDLVRDGENGLYVPPRDPAALRAAIRHLLDNPGEADRMGRAGRAMAESRLTLDRWVRDVAAIVERHRAA